MPVLSREVAARCLSDVRYAGTILLGSEYLDVKDAILSDLRAAPEVCRLLRTAPALPERTAAGGAPGHDSWSALPRPALRALARPGKEQPENGTG